MEYQYLKGKDWKGRRGEGRYQSSIVEIPYQEHKRQIWYQYGQTMILHSKWSR